MVSVSSLNSFLSFAPQCVHSSAKALDTKLKIQGLSAEDLEDLVKWPSLRDLCEYDARRTIIGCYGIVEIPLQH